MRSCTKSTLDQRLIERCGTHDDENQGDRSLQCVSHDGNEQSGRKQCGIGMNLPSQDDVDEKGSTSSEQEHRCRSKLNAKIVMLRTSLRNCCVLSSGCSAVGGLAELVELNDTAIDGIEAEVLLRESNTGLGDSVDSYESGNRDDYCQDCKEMRSQKSVELRKDRFTYSTTQSKDRSMASTIVPIQRSAVAK